MIMKKNYLLMLIAMFISGIAAAQIVQVTNISTDADAGIASPYVFNGEIYFEADNGDGVTGDELYKIKAGGSTVLVKNINVDPDDTTPNSDPKYFIEYKGKLYFTANDGDVTGHDNELWVTDGTEAGTHMIYDIKPGSNQGAIPQQFVIFNDNLYFMANDGTSTQFWKYDGVNDPVKVTHLKDDGFATPYNPIVDPTNNWMWFQANNGHNELHIMKPDESVEILDINPTNHGYTGSQAILYNGKLIFQGDNGTDGDELWISDGTLAGTTMLLDINATAAGENSDPESFVIYNDTVYFVADPGTGTQLWQTDGTTAGTKLVVEPNVGADGSVEELVVYNGKLYFTATDGANGTEMWVYDGTTAEMFMDINPNGDADPYGYTEVDGILFFEADNSGNGTELWFTNGSPNATMKASSAFTSSANPMDVNADEFVVIGSKLYFTADDLSGDEFFMLDVGSLLERFGQATDINPSDDSGIASPYVYNGEVYFEADNGDGTTGDELYKIASDGSVVLVKNINVDPDDTTPNSDPKYFIEYKGKLYFTANDGDVTGHDNELWVTDGTEAGTHMIYDIKPGSNQGAIPQQFVIFNDNLYFMANDGTSTQFWKYDGVNDPVKVTHLKDDGFATPYNPIVDPTNNWMWFQANNGHNELHIMKPDESVEILDINPTNHGYTGSQAILYNGKLIFQGDNGTDGDELWVSDGTLAGTTMLLDINATAAGANSDPESFVIYNDTVYFVADPGTGTQLWQTDGTTAGTKLVVEPNVGADGAVEELVVYNGKLYFTATDGTNGTEMWVYDGTTAEMFMDINPNGDSDPYGYLEVNGLLFFEADADGDGTRLWFTDGVSRTMTVAEALNLSVTPMDVNADEFAVVGTKLYYTADDPWGDDIFVVDTEELKSKFTQATDINPSDDSGIASPYVYNGEVYFEADNGDGTTGDELYKIASDGSVVLVKNINVDPDDTTPNSDPKYFIEYKGKLYFTANDGDVTGHDNELWVTDGTEAGTHMIYDIKPGSNQGAIPQQFVIFNDNLYFMANDGTSTQFWKYDGVNDPVKVTHLKDDGFATPYNPIVDPTNNWMWFQANNGHNELHIMKPDESVEILDINPTNHGYTGSQAILYNGKLIFQGDNGTDGDELWVSDGTLAGTTMLLDINATAAGANSDPESFVIYNDTVYFVADPGTGTQLWQTDGTTAGTKLVVEPNVGADGAVEELVVYNGKLYFTATDGTNGTEMWVYDGTKAYMFKDINPAGDADPYGYMEVDGLLFFEADADGTDPKLWVTNGSFVGTVNVASALKSSVDPADVNADEFAVVGTKLYYTADDSYGDDFFMVDARQLFSYPVTFSVTDGGAGIAGAEVTLAGETKTADSNGAVTFEYVRQNSSYDYTVNRSDYLEATGSIDLEEVALNEDVVMTLITYTITFSVTNGSSPVAGATVNFEGTDVVTDASGLAVFNSLVPQTGSSYTVTLANFNTADGTVDIDADKTVNVSLIGTGLKANNVSNLSIYPNPARNYIMIDGADNNSVYKIFDLSQRMVQEGYLYNNKIDFSLNPGIYFIQLNSNGKESMNKIVIE
jgi:ELWxxDGT repeat protein